MARPKLGDSESKRLQMVITEDELVAIEDWQYRNRVPSKSEAIRRLCQIAIGLEPLVADLRNLWVGVQQANTEIAVKLLDALHGVDQTQPRQNLEEINSLVKKLSSASLEFGIHAAAMVDVLEALKAGEPVKDAIEKMKKQVRDSEGTRAFVRDWFGGEE